MNASVRTTQSQGSGRGPGRRVGPAAPAGRRRPLPLALLALPLCLGLCGCTAVSIPVADAIPVRKVPPELLVRPHAEDCTIPLNLLRQTPPPAYVLAPGDVLGVFIEGVLGPRDQPPPVHIGPLVQVPDQRRLPSTSGFPVPVEPDGTVNLPLVDPVPVGGLTLNQAREVIRDTYVKKKLVKADTDRVMVTLLNPRQYQVMVFRQESQTFFPGPDGLNATPGGTGVIIDLPAYENDVLHALAATGGLPKVDACNEVVVFHGVFADHAEGQLIMESLKQAPGEEALVRQLGEKIKVTRIPLRTPHGEVPPIHPADIVLQNGDVVFIQARNEAYFYTGGLLPPGVFQIPRDEDLDVLEAVARVKGPLWNGAFGGSNLSGALIQDGLGKPSPTMLVVIRRTPHGGQVPIRVDLRRAMEEPQERILVKEGDYLILQQQPGEAILRYLSETVFNFNFAWVPIQTRNAVGVIDTAAPDRIFNSRLFNVFTNFPFVQQ